MGYTNGAGPEGSPQFNNTPQTVADLNRERDLIVERGNSRKGTASQRTALTVVNGQSFMDSTDSNLYAGIGGSWVPIAGNPVLGVLGHSSGVTPGGSEVLRKDFQGVVQGRWSGTYTSALADGSTIGSLPSGFRPAVTIDVPASMSVGGSAGACMVIIDNAGNIRVYGITSSGNRKVSFPLLHPAAP